MDFSNVLLRIETTNHCNFKCIFCTHNKLTRSQNLMEWALYEKIILEAEHLGFKTLDLRNFGEPLLDKTLEEKSKFAIKHGFRKIYVHTNGYFLTKERYNKLYESGLTWFIISLSPRREFDVTRGEGYYDTILNNLKDISTNKVDGSIVIDYINTGKSSDDEIRDFKNELENFGYEIREEISLHNWADDNSDIKCNDIKICQRLWNSFTVLVDGKVALCCLDYDGRNIVGDLNTQSIKEIINSAEYIKFRKSHLDKNLIGICKKCNMPYVKD